VRNLEELCNKYNGEVFIVGSGPSLHFQNIDFLKSHFTITINAGCLRFPRSNMFISDDQDSLEWQEICDELKHSKKTKILLYEEKYRRFGNLKECKQWFGDRLFCFSHKKDYQFTPAYQHNSLKNGIWQARCSMISALHIAYLLGFRKIVLLGADCICLEGKRYFYEFPGWKKPRRRKPFVQPRIPRRLGSYKTYQDLIEILNGWKLAARNIEKHCKVYNASKTSIIDAFPKINLDDLKCTNIRNS